MKTEDLALFNKVVEYQSQSAAARALGIPVSTISRNICHLEEHLGTRLLDRTTRSLALTEAGIELLERSKDILAAVEALELSVGQLQLKPEGAVTIAAPLDFINLACSDALNDFHQRHPKLRMRFISYQSRQNPMDVKADLVLFVCHGNPPDSSFIGHKLTSIKRSFIASPDFIAKHPHLTHPSQLGDYPCLLSAKGAQPANIWLWSEQQQSHSVEVDGPLESETNELCITAAVNGAGVAWVPPAMCQKYLNEGRLQQVFGDKFTCDVDIWGLYSSRHYLPHRVRLVLEFFQQELSQMQ
ncbi:putative transcriptional activator [Shewanella sediminis HAW-EB3]|uniref:Putative transcriptional activator n=1 Tax=Shewanella sediminis (strain HAW-EB3) TaxID=425104 RepID=A8FU15_SHESH|nr:LysR family transcriptional regulator [Shewanella sediminis]ABV36338.1 putative transcriptional activator [Shewanella sediminis HAW-EB3]